MPEAVVLRIWARDAQAGDLLDPEGEDPREIDSAKVGTKYVTLRDGSGRQIGHRRLVTDKIDIERIMPTVEDRRADHEAERERRIGEWVESVHERADATRLRFVERLPVYGIHIISEWNALIHSEAELRAAAGITNLYERHTRRNRSWAVAFDEWVANWTAHQDGRSVYRSAVMLRNVFADITAEVEYRIAKDSRFQPFQEK